ncbi:TetR/AcrR family transcriptional regulator [uncultured Aeromicrobium sp.]|uniref:TetR/AcrR family transcriptional regulator n=1 Tax=uncultured Aeromicrobium sp. TaxID=337820 RepID=UPI0025DF5E18|nr:TetR/AcrR family transcriptional regulator [uncultured Aeromicrobium sp.]
MSRRIDLAARKTQLAEAVWQVILDRGISAVSVRTVADQAGLVVGSLRHVFPTRAELLSFSAELMVQRATERVRDTPWSDDPQQYAFEVIKRLLPLDPESRAELEVNLALVAECSAQPGLREIRDHAHAQLLEACVRLVELLTGRPRDPELIVTARRLHALVDGLALHLLHGEHDDAQWALAMVRDDIARIAGAHESHGGVPS